MKLIKKLTAVLLCICMAGVLGACGHLDMDAKPQETKNISIAQPAESTVIEDEAEAYYIYITTNGRDFNRYPYEAEEVTAEGLIGAIEAQTGWTLTLAEPVAVGKDGLTVIFAGDSSLFGDVPSEQTAGFEVADREALVASILGSVQNTLKYFASPDAPENVNVYFKGEGDTPLHIDDILDLPLEQPYSYDYWHEDMEETSVSEEG